jgi:hypothetical protein
MKRYMTRKMIDHNDDEADETFAEKEKGSTLRKLEFQSYRNAMLWVL